MNTGIDYGLGQSNVDRLTGIRYGVISQHSIIPEAMEDVEYDYGYVKIEDGFESGFHPGQNDDPTKIYEKYSKEYSRLLFCIDSVGQFDMRFSIWYFPEDGKEEE